MAWRVVALGGLSTLGVLCLSDRAWQWWEGRVPDGASRSAMRAVFYGALGLHVSEALLAFRMARREGFDNSGAWARTAMLYGFPTLLRLRREIRGRARSGGPLSA